MALAAIPYHTFPEIISIGGFQLRTFGLMVGLGVLLGAWFAGSYGERIGVTRDETYRLATRLVIAGVIGARLTWDLATLGPDRDSVIDLIAVWEGGLQFSGGFVAAILVGIPTLRKWTGCTSGGSRRRLRLRSPSASPSVASAAPRSASTSGRRGAPAGSR